MEKTTTININSLLGKLTIECSKENANGVSEKIAKDVNIALLGVLNDTPKDNAVINIESLINEIHLKIV